MGISNLVPRSFRRQDIWECWNGKYVVVQDGACDGNFSLSTKDFQRFFGSNVLSRRPNGVEDTTD